MDKPDYELALRGLDEVARCIAEFHDKMQFKQYELYDEHKNDEVKSAVNHDLTKAGNALAFHANKLQSLVQFSNRATRGHLVIEEASEFVRALAAMDEVRMLDALIDLLYVTVGTCVSYGLPVGEAFLEVQLSNMTKEKQPDDPYANRVRDKGPNYRAPDLEGVLKRWRKNQQQSSAESSSAGGATP